MPMPPMGVQDLMQRAAQGDPEAIQMLQQMGMAQGQEGPGGAPGMPPGQGAPPPGGPPGGTMSQAQMSGYPQGPGGAPPMDPRMQAMKQQQLIQMLRQRGQ